MYRRLTLFPLLFTCVLSLLHCGSDSGKDGSASPSLPGPDGGTNTGGNAALSPNAELNGRYVQTILIDGESFTASAPGEEVALTFAAKGLSNVKQFEFRLRLDPASAFDVSASSFVPLQPFIAPPVSIEVTEEGLWRTGGASVTQPLEGEATFGTLKLKTANGFDANTQVRIQVDFFSVGPSFSDRDDYSSSDLKMGVVVNE
ncbi:MAG: hypothetical protein ACKVJG_07970 [Candidatus Latescibacterota bacterium]|jgi:hypothetical protein